MKCGQFVSTLLLLVGSASLFVGCGGGEATVMPTDERPIMTDAEEKEYEQTTMGSVDDEAQN